MEQVKKSCKYGDVTLCGEHIVVKINGINKRLSEYDMLALAFETDNIEDAKTIIKFLDRVVPATNTTYNTLRNSVMQSMVAMELQQGSSHSKSDFKTYLMKDGGTGYTKIGRSINPKFRERTLKSEQPNILLKMICDCNVEKELHKKYAVKHIRGEWYNLSAKDIEEISAEYGFYNYPSIN